MATKRTVNNESRDVKRKLNVMRKKCSELKELGVSVAVFYSSRKVNGIQYFRDRRYTDVVEKHKDDILLNPHGTTTVTMKMTIQSSASLNCCSLHCHANWTA